MVVHGFVLEDGQNAAKEEEKAFVQTADVTDPIKYAVNITVDSVQGEIKFESDLHVHVIGELVGPVCRPFVAEHANVVLGDGAELHQRVLQVQVHDLHLVDDLLAHLRVYRDVDEFGFLCNFTLIKICSGKPNLIPINDNEFASQPCLDLLFTFTYAREL